MKFSITLLIAMILFSQSINAYALKVNQIGTGEYGHHDGKFSEAIFSNPMGLYISKDKRVYIVDSDSNQIRIMNQGIVTSLFTNVNEKFNRLSDLVVNSKNEIFVTDTNNNCIWMIKNGEVSTFAGLNESGFVDGTSQTARFNHPTGLAIDHDDNIYVADTLNHAIRRITPNGSVSTVCGLLGKQGYIDGNIKIAMFNEPQDLVLENNGKSLLISDTGNSLIRKFEKGRVETYVGKMTKKDNFTNYAIGGHVNGAAKEALLESPTGLVVDEFGTLFIADPKNKSIRILKAGKLTSARIHTPGGILTPRKIDVLGERLYITDQLNDLVYSVNKSQLIRSGADFVLLSNNQFESYKSKEWIMLNSDLYLENTVYEKVAINKIPETNYLTLNGKKYKRYVFGDEEYYQRRTNN